MDIQSKTVEFYMLHRGSLPSLAEALDMFIEESQELIEAVQRYLAGEDTLDHVAKEIGDNGFVVAAIAEVLGVEYEVALDIVAEDNIHNKVQTRSGKIKRKEGYEPPSMKAAIL